MHGPKLTHRAGNVVFSDAERCDILLQRFFAAHIAGQRKGPFINSVTRDTGEGGGE